MVCVMLSLLILNLSHTAPSEPPSNVGATSTSSTITVQWEMVPCIHRNGDITGYSVQYTGGRSTQTMSVPGGDTLMTTIEGVMSSTNYSIEVAAVNDNLIGKYSDPVIVETLQSKLGHSVHYIHVPVTLCTCASWG